MPTSQYHPPLRVQLRDKPDEPPGQSKNRNNELCTTCSHPRNIHQKQLYYCKASVMADDPDKPGHAKIKAPCPCTAFNTIEQLAINTDPLVNNQDSPDKDKFDRSGVDIKETVQTQPPTKKPEQSISNPTNNDSTQPIDPVINDDTNANTFPVRDNANSAGVTAPLSTQRIVKPDPEKTETETET